MIVTMSGLDQIREQHIGAKIAYCHGVFNCLHAGHILHLKWAKEHADVLVVGITADAYVDKRRSEHLMNEFTRAEMINHLSFVDYTVIVPWSNATAPLDLLCPDVYVKGQEYRDQMTEALALEKKHCNKLVFSETPKLTSSTRVINTVTEAIDIFGDTERIDCILYSVARYKFVYRLLHGDETVLDVGCGYGYGTKLLSKACHLVVGCDVNPDCIAIAEERFPEISFACQDFMTEKEPFDVVVCMEVLEHLKNPDEFLNRVAAIKKRFAVFSTPRELPYEKRSEVRRLFHVQEYSHGTLYALLKKHFNVVLIFTQTDEIVSSGNPDVTWTYIAICI